MRITELLKRESIGLDVAADSKEEAIDKLVSLMDACLLYTSPSPRDS